MDKKLLQRIKNLGDSFDIESRDLSRILFWASSPKYEDFVFLEGGARINREQFLAVRNGIGIYRKDSVPCTGGHVREMMKKVREEKYKMVKTQQFQYAANLRDVEKKLQANLESRIPWKPEK